MGGPGAIFWMWISAVVGMSTKFFTSSLAIMYRGKDSEGELQGGPMYFITEGLGKKWKPLAIFFSACAMIGALPVFNVNQLTQQTALKALQNSIKTNNEIAIIISERNKLIIDLEEISFIVKVYPSDANFLLVKVDNAIVRYHQLVEHEIIVRNRTNLPLCENCLRFTVGTKEENKKLMNTLKLL